MGRTLVRAVSLDLRTFQTSSEMLARASERYEGGLNAYGPRDRQLRIARVAGTNHLAVSFEDPELEKARQARRIIEQTRL
jgi:hypothetical protein